MILLLSACWGHHPTDDIAIGDDTATPDADTATGDLDPETVPLGGACTDDVRWGIFSVESNEDYAYVTGVLTDGVVPASILTDVLDSGECTIWRRENPFCDPTCGPGYTCDFDGTCVPYPEGQDLGTVSVSGLVQPVSMTPVTPGYTYFDTSLPNPPWEPGALVTLHTGGGAYDAVSVHGVAPTPLETTDLTWVITPGEPFAVSWDAPTGSVRTEVALTLRIDQHGLTPSNVVCHFADDGAGEVPADVLDELMSLGVSGFPAGTLERRTVDHAALGDGCLDFTLTSSRLPSVSISGYTPCTRDEECPDGLSCNEAMERCE